MNKKEALLESLNEMSSKLNTLVKEVEKINICEEEYEDEEYYDSTYLNEFYNDEEVGKVIATIENQEDFIDFLSGHINKNGFKGIKLGNIIKTKLSLSDLMEIPYVTIDKDDDDIMISWIVTNFNCNGKIGLFPTENIFKAPMNITDTTFGGYDRCLLKKEILPRLIETLKDKFTNTISSISYDTFLDEYNIFGKIIYQVELVGIRGNQLPLFKFISLNELIIREIFSAENFWLRGVGSASRFCFASFYGDSGLANASAPIGVRPFIYIWYKSYVPISINGQTMKFNH